MHLDEYQNLAMATAVYPGRGNNLTYPVLGLNGEAGEVAEQVKKIIRDDGGALTPDRQSAIVKELGDALWYLALAADEIDVQLSEVAQININKLSSRQERGVLRGSGDER